MSMPLVASLKGASTRPFTGQVQSTSSLSVPLAFSGAGEGVAGAGADTGGAPGDRETGGGASAARGEAPDSAAFICASARSENGTFDARGSTFAVCVLASGR